MKLPDHKTRIVCTIGPASDSLDVMRRMILAGMDVARLNFSHGDFDTHGRVIENLRAAATGVGRRIAIMADLPGPKMRIGKLAEEAIRLVPGEQLTLTTDEADGDCRRIPVSFERLPQSVRRGDKLYLNDGYIQLEVTGAAGSDVTTRVLVGGELRSRKGLNLPGIDLGIGAFTKRDRECLRFALGKEVDAVSQSFVESAADIEAVRQASAELGHQPFIIAKIERSRALERIDEIMAAADGIMIARGDLGVEVPIESIAVVQKGLMRRANRRAKPVITATQMLESMISNRRPTRAEATDVSNAILDGTDAVMLSGESAMGSYPVESVEMLAKIAAAVERGRPMITVREMFQDSDIRQNLRPGHLISLGVEACLEYATPAAVFIPTLSGATARGIGRFRLPSWIVAVSPRHATCQALQFCYGVHPVHEPDYPDDWNGYIKSWLGGRGVEGDIAVLTEGPSDKHPEANHRMEIISLK